MGRVLAAHIWETKHAPSLHSSSRWNSINLVNHKFKRAYCSVDVKSCRNTIAIDIASFSLLSALMIVFFGADDSARSKNIKS